MPTHAQDVVANQSLIGWELCEALTARTDAFLAALFADAQAPTGTALLAVGGYGRGELCPESDIDVVLVHQPDVEVAELAERLWYPLWDAGLKLGQQVGTVEQILEVGQENLEVATSLLAGRLLAGQEALAEELVDKAQEQWSVRADHYLKELAEAVDARHQKFGEVAFLLEPDLKEARGGLRDVHTLQWVENTSPILRDSEAEGLSMAFTTLLTVRVELHRLTGRHADRLLLELQDEVADRLGYRDADQLMASVAAAARVIAWTGDGVHRRISRVLDERSSQAEKTPLPSQELSRGVSLIGSRIEVSAEALDDPMVVLRCALLAAQNEAYLDRPSLELLAKEAIALPNPWPDEARHLFEEILFTGWPAVSVFEDLDQSGLLVGLISEWAPCQSRPQRNAYHRFTVDRHLLETAAQAAQLVGRVERPDLLVVGAMLHDIGKGYPGDHMEVGIDLMVTIAGRMGYPTDDVAMLVSMVELHLLLPDVATRRDLDDDGTIRSVAATAGSTRLLHLLGALTEADSIATGPSAWSSWKAGLVHELVMRASHVLEGGDVLDVIGGSFPNHEQQDLLASDQEVVRGEGSTLTVVANNRPGAFSKVAGVLALNGLGVFGAMAHTERHRAISVFRVDRKAQQDIDWDRIAQEVKRALSGRLAVAARLGERSRTERTVTTTARPAAPRLTVDNETSQALTVLEVSCPDGIGVLYRITRGFAELDLDIMSARVQTLGSDVIDAFYVRDSQGNKIMDQEHLAEIELAVLRWIRAEL